MSLSAPLLSLTVAEYLESEKISPMRREYLAGQVFGMGGTSATHNLIAGNVFARLRAHLRGRPCRVFISDMKVRIEAVDFFYYPDVLVTRDPEDSEEYFKTRPCLIIEVASPTTALIDKREKLLAYQKLDSLREYVLIAQDEMKAQVYRRDQAGSWWLHTFGPEDQLCLESVDLEMTVAEVYEGISL